MATFTRRLGTAALMSVAVGLLASTSAWAQPRPNTPLPPQAPFRPVAGFAVNPSYMVAPGLPLNQLAFNISTLGRAYRHVPPWLAGYNPYPQAVNFGPSFPSFYSTPAYGGGLPYGAAFTSASPYGASSLYTSPYAGSPGYGGSPGYDASYYSNPYSYYADPYGGGLRGAADAIRAQGQFEIDFQHARLLNQEVERSKMDTRRKIYDEWLYERANTPTVVDIQERSQRSELRRALVGMPLSEIVNAYALNTLLRDLAKKGNWGVKDNYGPIDPETLKQINVTSRSSSGNLGVLKAVKEGAPLNWPLVLQGLAYQDEVRRLNQKAAEAVKLLQNTGVVEPAMLNDMKEDVKRLRAKVSGHINDLTLSQSIEANRFLNQLDDAVTALRQPDANTYFTLPKGKTVAELVKYMSEKGLEFAPATGGDEAAYSALYNYLVSYAMQAGAAPSTGSKD
jgi:hypothetical protein